MMAKKESLNNKEDKILAKLELDPDLGEPPRSKLFVFSGRIFGLIKFIIGVCLLPFVYSVSVAFLNEFNAIDKTSKNYFWAGVVGFVILYLFIWEPVIIYKKGHRLLEIVFQFFKPLVRVAPYLLPIYSIVIFVGYLLFSFMFKTKESFDYFIFLFSFSIAFHLIFGAKSIRAKQGDFMKANYIFGFSFVYIIDVLLLSFCLNIIFREFSFVNFFNNSCQTGSNIFYTIFKQLFMVKF